MSSSKTGFNISKIRNVAVTDDTLTVDLLDGRTISVPIGWYPRLAEGTPDEQANWRLVGHGEGVHWPDLDEDISAENLITGHPSGESQQSFKKWKEDRSRGSMATNA